MNDASEHEQSNFTGPDSGSQSSQRDHDPHAEDFTSRDWKIMAYFAGLGIIPLLAILVVIYILLTQYPNFDNFPDPDVPLHGYEAGSVLK
ncbi:MAG: hypothetical protein JKY95_07430 [Planctomycetaceae bacterium]|nr:hypothetical protein [Planctomycetaceae bacterium]